MAYSGPQTRSRIVLIPFTVKIPEDKADGELADKLREEGPGVLAWLVQGALDWLRLRLAIPERVSRCASEYRADQDVLSGFFSDCCDTTNDFLGQPRSAMSADIYVAYRKWAEQMGERIMSSQKFGRMLGERGYESTKTTGGRRVWRGIGLTTNAYADLPSPGGQLGERSGSGAVADIGPFPESTHVSGTKKVPWEILETDPNSATAPLLQDEDFPF